MTEDQARFFSDAFEAHYRVVLGFCRRYMSNIEDAADATATTFMHAWRRIDDFERVEYQRAWLIKTARLTMANLRRSSSRSGALADKIGTLAVGYSPDSADRALDATNLEAALAALQQLSEADQEIIALAAFESFTHEELAEALDITAKTARSRLYRARQRLREVYAGDVAT